MINLIIGFSLYSKPMFENVSISAELLLPLPRILDHTQVEPLSSADSEDQSNYFQIPNYSLRWFFCVCFKIAAWAPKNPNSEF